MIKQQTGLACLILSVVFVAACQKTSVKTQPVSKELAAHVATAHSVGYTRKTKDLKGRVWTAKLVSVENDLYNYIANDGYEWTNYINPLLPSPIYSGADWGIGSQEMTKVKGALFPLTVGNKMSFTVVGKSDRTPEGWTEFRKCNVNSQERVTVEAGEFDAFKVVCDSEWRRRVYFFSPEVNDIVWYRNTHKTEPKKSSGWELIEAHSSSS